MSTVDLRSYADLRQPAGLRRPAAERRLGEFLGAVVEAMTSPFEPFEGEQPLALRCLGRDKPRCPGRINAQKADEVFEWRCPACGEAGAIEHWQRSVWDFARYKVSGLAKTELATIRMAAPVLEATASIPALDRAADRVLATGRRVGPRAVALRAPQAWLGHLAGYVANELNHVDDDDQYLRRLEQAYEVLERFS
ncbi:MAG: hypothetical protein KC613_03075 [Myxococcales bacterium]|nr:hypothetical protein [Myxococcales bacterium]